MPLLRFRLTVAWHGFWCMVIGVLSDSYGHRPRHAGMSPGEASSASADPLFSADPGCHIGVDRVLECLLQQKPEELLRAAITETWKHISER
ncbi:MAG: hypothetical protein MUQ27_03425 [Acidimicrobiia bacterium]|nr:hypothetical protein [Acidimicrobiia bacterium]